MEGRTMTNTELTQFIKHYLEKDKTKSSIMLSGDWGTGKSHYIQYELLPALQADGVSRCVTVSLYGTKTVTEISKSIYLELRAKILHPQGEAAATGKMVAKTLAKGITSFFGIDLSTSEEEMRAVYESIDLSGKLIILEDVERSQINILELLGYVNNLVEQDGVKVLLVANENEILKYDEIEQTIPEKDLLPFQRGKGGKRIVKVPTDETLEYLATKEKTVSDTILFESDFRTAIQQIIMSYGNPILNKFATWESAKDICDIMAICKNYNLRSFIFACQKSADIFEQMAVIYGDDFLQCVFFGIIFFALRIKAGEIIPWDGGENYSVNLGHERTPLFKFCYDYIMVQKLDLSKLSDAVAAFEKKQLYDKQKTAGDPDLCVLYDYHLHYEADVVAAVQNITKRLKNPSDISFYDYGTIALYLVAVKHLLGCDVESAKTSLVSNLEGRGEDLRYEELFRIAMGEEKEVVKKEYDALRKEMGHALKRGTESIPGFGYQPEDTKALYDYAAKNDGLFRMKGSFAKNFDIPRLAELFSACSPEQKNNIRGAFLGIYRPSNIKSFMAIDLDAIEELLQLIQAGVEEQTDGIQKLQYEWFVANLTEILNKLN